MSIALSGTDVKVMWGFEAVAGTADTTDKVFGVCPNLQSWTINRNYQRNTGMGNREPCGIIKGRTEGSLSVSFSLTSDTEWLEAVFPTTTGSPVTNYDAGSSPKTLTIASSFLDDAGASISYTFAGCRCTNMDLSVEMDNAIIITLDFVYMTVATGTASLSPTYALSPLEWTDAAVVVGTLSSSTVQSASITVATGVENRYGLGAEDPSYQGIGNYEYTVSIDHLRNTDDSATSLMTAGAKVDGTLTVSYGVSDTIVFNFKNCGVTSYDTSAIDADDVVETLELMPQNMDVDV